MPKAKTPGNRLRVGKLTISNSRWAKGRMLPEFEAAVRGMAPGQTKTFPLTFPANYGAQALAGKAVTFEVTVKQVQQPVLAPIDAEFARSLGVADGDVAKMRSEISNNLSREVAARLKARTKDQAMAALLSTSSFDVPKSLVEPEKQRLAEGARSDLIARGMARQGCAAAARLVCARGGTSRAPGAVAGRSRARK